MTRLLAVAFAVLVWLTGSAPAADSTGIVKRVGAWFKIDNAAAAEWAYSVPDPDNDKRVELRPLFEPLGPAYRIMVIYPRKSTAYDTALSTILKDFAARRLNAELTIANYGNDKAAGAALVEEAERDGYALVYAMGSETVAWLWAEHRDIGVPVVTVCAKDPVQLGQMADYEHGSGTSFAFTSLNVLLDVQLEYLKVLDPGLRNIGILVDATNASAVETQAKPLAKAATALGINAFDVAVTDPEQAKAQLQTLLPEALARMRETDPELAHSLFWITGSTAVFVEIATINALAGKVPVLATVPEVVQAGDDSAVLSIGVSFVSNAQLAAVYGVDILTGKVKPGELRVGIVSPPDIAVSFRRADAIGLKVPFSFFEAATFVYDVDGKPVRAHGRDVAQEQPAS
ncbi:MAG: ABC transporter substrate binding protein [Geminicoccaceae bacterium]